MKTYSGNDENYGKLIQVKVESVKRFVIVTWIYLGVVSTQPAITCSKLTIEILAQGVKYVQS